MLPTVTIPDNYSGAGSRTIPAFLKGAVGRKLMTSERPASSLEDVQMPVRGSLTGVLTGSSVRTYRHTPISDIQLAPLPS